MTFWTCMLHCYGGLFYVGHTDDLDRRIARHKAGTIPGFTRDYLPVTLVWSQDFPSRYEALAMGRRIKGWSKAKMALIRGDRADLQRLAKSRNTASTSSARTGEE